MNLRFQDVLDKTNKSELFLQELELLILNYLGSKEFSWTSFEEMRKKNSIHDSLRKVRGFIDKSMEIREHMRQLNKEHLRLQLSAKNLELSSKDIEIRANEIKDKLIDEGLVDFFLNEHKVIKTTPMLEAPKDEEVSEMKQMDFTQDPDELEVDMVMVNPKSDFSDFSYRVV